MIGIARIEDWSTTLQHIPYQPLNMGHGKENTYEDVVGSGLQNRI